LLRCNTNGITLLCGNLFGICNTFCQTICVGVGTSGTSGTCGTSFWELVVHREHQGQQPDNLFGIARQYEQSLPGASIVIRLPNNISSSTVAHGREIKNPRISTRVRQVVTN